ncbi:holo-ACP synthase [Pseudogracilibacillus sp. SE30717A]|uniref:holo-ACP synthase n=1 Tax=Pseudogracilibacillus sp. SE30717A TaxID=3098293 RepID=UPI00300E4F16
MINGIGIDIIELNRIKNAVLRNERFIERILTKREQARYHSFKQHHRKIEYLAGRFAAKEAFAKATGTGIGKLSFQHIEIVSNSSGAPTIYVEGYESKNIYISISHSKEYAVAQIIITK